MVIEKPTGQLGRDNWIYGMNPCIGTATGKQNILDDDWKNRKYYLRACLDDNLPYSTSEERNVIYNSNRILTFTWYKWCIGEFYDSGAGSDYQYKFAIFANVNGELKRSGAGSLGSTFLGIDKSDIYSNIYPDTTWANLTRTAINVNTDLSVITFHIDPDNPDDAGWSAMLEYLFNDEEIPSGYSNEEDPYADLTPTSTTGGGDGNGRTTELVDEPGLPTYSAVATGMVTLYVPSQSELRSLATKLWSNDFITNIVKNFASPFDALLGLSIFPMDIPEGSTSVIKVGNYDTQIGSHKVQSQYLVYDLGACRISPEVGSYLDYAPYTKINLFLPYIGFAPLNVDEVMGKEISLKYHIDLLTGSCVAYLFVNGYVHNQYSGNVATNIPLSGRDFGQMYSSAIQVALSGIGAVATGGMTAALSAGSLAASASTLASSKPHIQHGGSLGGSAGILGIQKPYVIIESPNRCLPANQNKFVGYPTYITETLGNLSGYTVVDNVHLEGIPCTNEELDEIENLLKEGVIL